MPRVTKAKIAKTKHKNVLKSTKGHYGARSRLYKTAKQSNIKALQYAFRDRKNRKRAFKSLWISRINAGARSLGTNYSDLIYGLKKKNILLNRKILSDLAVNDTSTFKKVIKVASE
jgi:large subunit ribosomal protein L20|tara:strand:+ start:3967 stop:4314 length:348 start_codon:yes stop_codon:yes gene_type:complete